MIRHSLCLLLIPTLLLAPALCQAHALEEGDGPHANGAPHFHASSLFFLPQKPQSDEPDDDDDAIPLPEQLSMTRLPGSADEAPPALPPLLLALDSCILVAIPAPVLVKSFPPPRSRVWRCPLYLTVLSLRL